MSRKPLFICLPKNQILTFIPKNRDMKIVLRKSLPLRRGGGSNLAETDSPLNNYNPLPSKVLGDIIISVFQDGEIYLDQHFGILYYCNDRGQSPYPYTEV